MKKIITLLFITAFFSFQLTAQAINNAEDSSCFPFIEIIGDTIHSGKYQSSSYIESGALILNPSNVDFRAMESITLVPGFEVESDATFNAEIEGCEADSSIYTPLVLINSEGIIYRPPNTNSANQRNLNHCLTCGHFTLKFLDGGVGFDDSVDPVLALARRTVTCDVFEDLSALIVNPDLTAGEVTIEIKPSLINNPGPALAVAEVLHAVGFDDGIIDNGVWRTLMTGRDSWELLDVVGANNWPHGSLQVNFDSARPYVYNDADRNLCVGPGDRDFYSIILHEALHLLGIYSLIDGSHPNRISHLTNSFGRNHHVYSRYDQHLFSSTSSLINYNSPFDINPNITVPLPFACPQSNNVFFNGSQTSNQSVFTGAIGGNWWGSSLSHLNCSADDSYIMNPSLGPGSVQRAPHPNEIAILHDLGYHLSGTFGAMNCPSDPECTPLTACNMQDHIPFATYNTPQQNDICHIGVNDQYTGALSGDLFTINANGPDGYLTNDIFPIGPTSQVSIQGNPDHGQAIILANGDIEFTPDPTFIGWTYLIYALECSGAQQGNITYITIEVDPQPLPLCVGDCQTGGNILCYGDFEDFVPGGFYPQVSPAFPIANVGNSYTPDICRELGTNNFANANLGIGEVIMLPLSTPLLPNCTATIEFSVGFNFVTTDATSSISGDVLIWMSEDMPCTNDIPIVENNLGLPNPTVGNVYMSPCNNPVRNFSIVSVENSTYLSPGNNRGLCLGSGVNMSTYQITWQNNTANPLNFFYITGRPLNGYGFGKFDDITITSNCPPNEITITPNPDPITLCGTGNGSVDFTICSDPGSVGVSQVSYDAIPRIPSLRNLTFTTPSMGTLSINPGACQKLTLDFTSDLVFGDIASIELNNTVDNGCVTGTSTAEVDIQVLNQIDVQASPTNMTVCPGEVGVITYEICHNEPVPLDLEYESLNLLSPPNGVQIVPNQFFNAFGQSPNPVTIPVSPTPCLSIELEFTASINPGEQVIIVLNPDPTQACISDVSNVWTTVTHRESLTLTTTPSILNLCNGQNAVISYEVCNTTPSLTFPTPYNVTVPGGINCTNCTGIIPGMAIGACESFDVTVESNLLPNAGGWAELELGGSLYCLTGSNTTAILTPVELEINPVDPAVSICPGYTDQIAYEIVNNNAFAISLDYDLWPLGLDQNVVMNPAGGTYIAQPGLSILTIDILNNNPLGSTVTIRLVPRNLNQCISNGSVHDIVVNTPQTCFFLDGNVFLGGVDQNFDPTFCDVIMIKGVAVPNQSPYDVLGYPVTACQTDDFYPWATLSVEVIDWLRVELRDPTDPSIVICSKDALLLNNGTIFDPQSPQGVFLPLSFQDVPNGDYHLAVRHRNHLDVMSDDPINFTNGVVSACHFSNGTQAGNFQGVVVHNSLCTQITLWSLYAGDVNDSGSINAGDRSLIFNALGTTGYTTNDILTDGVVDMYDQDRVWENRNRVSNVPQ